MKNLLGDIKSSVGIYRDIRRARKAGSVVIIKREKCVPVFRNEVGFYETVEGCALSHCGGVITDKCFNAFKKLSCEDKRLFSSSPQSGEFTERAHYWKALLEPVLEPDQLRRAMLQILRWYIHIKHLRQEGAA